jgi:hypothetical protein
LSVLPVQNKIDAVYKDQKKWTHMSIMSTAGMGKFSTDRTIDEYAKVRSSLFTLPSRVWETAGTWQVATCVVRLDSTYHFHA